MKKRPMVKLTKLELTKLVEFEISEGERLAGGVTAGVELLNALLTQLETTKGRVFQLPMYEGSYQVIVNYPHYTPNEHRYILMVMGVRGKPHRMVLISDEVGGTGTLTYLVDDVSSFRQNVGVITLDGTDIPPTPKGDTTLSEEQPQREKVTTFSPVETAMVQSRVRQQRFQRPVTTQVVEDPNLTTFNLSTLIDALEGGKGVMVLNVVKALNSSVDSSCHRDALMTLNLNTVDVAPPDATIFSTTKPTLQVLDGVKLLIPDVELGVMYRIDVMSTFTTVHPMHEVSARSHIRELDNLLTNRLTDLLTTLNL